MTSFPKSIPLQGVLFLAPVRSVGKHAEIAALIACISVVMLLQAPAVGPLSVSSSPILSLATTQTAHLDQQAAQGYAACTPMMLNGLINSYPALITESQAAAAANESSAYSAATQETSGSATIEFNGVAIVGNANTTQCKINSQSYQVAYTLVNSTGPKGQLSIWVNQTTGSVTSSALDWQANPSTSATYQWTGYTTKSKILSGYSPTGTWAAWTGFGVSQAESNCGATIVTPGVCQISFWGGLTNESGGGNGIAQSGILASVVCVFVVYEFICSPSYVGWYEFYSSSSSSPVNCLSFSSPNDDLASFIDFTGSNEYTATIEDLTTGKYCDASSSMSMGAASYSQWQVESSSNLVGGILDIPAFNFWFTSNIAEGFPYNLVNYVVPSNQVPGVSLGAETYNAGACAGNDYSCFQVWS